MNALLRILLGTLVAAPAGFLAALSTLVSCQVLGLGPSYGKPLGHNSAESALGDLIVMIGIVAVAPLFGAVGSATGRPIVVALVGSVLAPLIVIWVSGGLAMARHEIHLVVASMTSWAAAGAAGGFLGYFIRPSSGKGTG